MTGIYKIVNKVNSKVYFGQSLDIKTRLKQHRYHLKKGDHRNPHLQRSYNKHGKNSFSFFVVELVEEELLTAKEQFYIDQTPVKLLYNIVYPELGVRISKRKIPHYVYDTLTGELSRYSSRRKTLKTLNIGDRKVFEGTLVNNRYVISLSPWDDNKCKKYDDDNMFFVYTKEGRFFGKYVSRAIAEKTLDAKLGTGMLKDSKWLCFWGDQGCSVPAYIEKRGKTGSRPWVIYDAKLNEVDRGDCLGNSCVQNNIKYNRALPALNGKYTKYLGKGKSKTMRTRWYKGYYWAPPSVDIKDWVKRYEVNQNKRL